MFKRKYQAGHTVIEVLIAAAVAAVGFAAVFSLQMNTMLTNISARDMAAAMTLGERYVEVLRRDSFAWTGDERPDPFLSQEPGGWHSFSQFPVDHNGLVNLRDDDRFGSALERQRFCVHYWFEPLGGLYTQMMNVRVRVIWSRNALDASNMRPVCPEEGADDFVMDVSKWFSVTIPSVLRSAEG
jgi:type II secretory pathway pseudopilin PulG